DAVELTRRAGKRSAAPLVNAVLRRISRERGALPLPPRPVEPADREAALAYLSDTLSHPQWLASRWLERYGFEAAAAWEQFDNRAAPLTLRANRLKTGRDELRETLATHGVRTRPARFAPDGLIVESGNPLLLPNAGDGLFVVQDEASQLVALFAAARPDERVLDACASPGGKTTAMAASMEDRGLLIAMDVRQRRMDVLARTVHASGARCVRIVQADAALPLPFAASFDCVLVDAPCSGLGTLRRDPDVRWRRSEQALPALADLQIRILEAAAAVVRTGGRIIYSTCSGEPEENEGVVEEFLTAHPEFMAAPPPDVPEHIRPLVSDAGELRTLPFRDGLEAFFAAMLVKSKDLR
ncbi:MAG: 16S rRNA (cytosine(967)-C(5))-methyltransferase RsmB, partial [Acidobacteria bacterium]|nr:16S rRNA (cytosine(967)-C(5))-methyltransferase RsmB [Acidobacteriota bacterium]